MFQIFDQSARSPSLFAYVFVAVSDPVTVSGFFVDLDGVQKSGLMTFDVEGEAVTFRKAISEIPQDAYGFVGTLSGPVYFGTGADLETGEVPEGRTPGEKWPMLQQTDLLMIGRVSV